MPSPDEMRRMMSEMVDNSRSEVDKSDVVLYSLKLALNDLKRFKPNDCSELDRRYAVTITKMEDVFAYFSTYVMASEE